MKGVIMQPKMTRRDLPVKTMDALCIEQHQFQWVTLQTVNLPVDKTDGCNYLLTMLYYGRKRCIAL